MSLDKHIHSHLDEMEAIEALIQLDIDEIMANIDKELIITNPAQALGDAVEALKQLMIDKYLPMASEQGFNLSEIIKKGSDIVVDPSKNPNENEVLVNDNGDNKK